MAREVTSKHIDGITDLVVVAPIREGFIDAYENVTFDTRLRVVMEALHNVRVNAREYERTVPFSDTAERILDLLNYRIGILDRGLFQLHPWRGLRARRYAYLSVTFDGAWEPYMRLVWEPLGTFLDLVFCNCEGYKPARDSSYEEYIAWVRKWQVDSAIFYSTTGLTVRDQIYLRNFERIQRERDPGAGDLELTALTMTDPAADARAERARNPVHAVELGLEALTILYRLADYYQPDRLDPVIGKQWLDQENESRRQKRQELLGKEQLRRAKMLAERPAAEQGPAWKAPADEEDDDFELHSYAEGRYLLRAARDLLDNIPFKQMLTPELYALYKSQLDWYYADAADPEKPDKVAGALLKSQRSEVEDPAFVQSDAQTGILHGMGRPERPVREGALLLMTVTDAEAARAFLDKLAPQISYEVDPIEGADQPPPMPADGIYCTIGFTLQGLTRLGLYDEKRALFPKEFREGMVKRAGLMGDLRENHPRNWTPPVRNWPPIKGSSPARPVPPVELDEVDFVIQLRYAPDPAKAYPDPNYPDPAKPYEPGTDLAPELMDRIEAISRLAEESADLIVPWKNAKRATAGKDLLSQKEIDELPGKQGVVLAAYEPMASYVKPVPAGSVSKERFGHFGLRDGISQPAIGTKDEATSGKYEQKVSRGELFVGLANDRGDQAPTSDPADGDLRFQGSFLVVRKIEQDVKWFETYLAEESQRISVQYGIHFTSEDLQAKLLGRAPDGKALVTTAPEDTTDNDFTYARDPNGHACPLGSHVRRANPRDTFQKRPSPRILRRGMSFGPEKPTSSGTRGVIFMAYCSSIAEQYETIQRWINGGNSTGQNAAQNDPLIGVLPAEGPKVFRFVHEGKAIRAVIPKPFVKLHWGLYLFVPSRPRLNYIANKFEGFAAEDNDPREDRGRAMMEQIAALQPPELAFDQWKRILEDFDTKDPAERDLSPDVWSAIRYFQRGCYRIPNSARLVESYATGSDPVQAVPRMEDGKEVWSDKPDAPAIMLVGSKDQAEQVLADCDTFAVDLQAERFAHTSGDTYVAMQPGPRYADEADPTNKIVFDYEAKKAFDLAYEKATTVLQRGVKLAEDYGRKSFKLELRRDFLAPTLAALCNAWFGMPDAEFFEEGAEITPDTIMAPSAWSWAPLGPGTKRPAVCPGDFLAPSRDAFYPQPNHAAQDYAKDHGRRILEAGRAFVRKYHDSDKMPGDLSKQMAAAIRATDHPYYKRADWLPSVDEHSPADNLLASNIIGMMMGMLPPIDGNLRGILYEWLSERTLWRHQGALWRATDGKPGPVSFKQAKVLCEPIARAMCKRPGPDLLYRRATKDYLLEGSGPDAGRSGKAGDIVIVSLVSVTHRSLRKREPDISMIFGGNRTNVPAHTENGEAFHACPAQKMMMGAIIGIMAALLNVGRIRSMPSSLIVELSDWR